MSYYTSNVFLKATQMDVDMKWAAGRRLEFLLDQADTFIEEHYFTGDSLMLSWADEALGEFFRLAEGLPMRLKKKTFQNEITASDIERAREYPIAELFELKRVLAWCHKDQNPSLHVSVAKNRAFCNPCGKAFNPIDVLVQRDGYSFVDAVRRLSK